MKEKLLHEGLARSPLLPISRSMFAQLRRANSPASMGDTGAVLGRYESSPMGAFWSQSSCMNM